MEDLTNAWGMLTPGLTGGKLLAEFLPHLHEPVATVCRPGTIADENQRWNGRYAIVDYLAVGGPKDIGVPASMGRNGFGGLFDCHGSLVTAFEPAKTPCEVQSFYAADTTLSDIVGNSLGCNRVDRNHVSHNFDALLDSSLYRVYKAAGVAPSLSLVPASGQQLEKLEFVEEALELQMGEWLKATLTTTPDLVAPDMILEYKHVKGFPSIDLQPLFSWGEISKLYRIFRGENPQVTRRKGHPTHRTRQAFARKLLRKVRRRARSLRQSLFLTASPFCGLSWSRRLWFLMHGSHPPHPRSGSYLAKTSGALELL